jgi:UDP-N-acetylmuramoyl-tripeptide--D-alanyl-D-alanine ligase
MRNIFYTILALLARAIVRKYRPDIIGITGSVGKTSAKEAVLRVLAGSFTVRGNEKSYNNELGVPLTIIGAHAPARSLFGWLRILAKALLLIVRTDTQYPSILVLEMGADAPGDIQHLVSIAPPKIGVITAIGPAHLEKFQTMERLVAEKKKIFCRHSTSDHWMVLNADDPALFPLGEHVKACVMTFGRRQEATVRISDVTERYAFHPDRWEVVSGIQCTLNYQQESVRAELPKIVGQHVLPSIIAGAAVGCIYHIPLTEIARRLRGAEPAVGRMHLIEGIRQTLLIDDTYNSSPHAARGALDTIMAFDIDSDARHIAVLGDMRELGEYTEREHRALGAYAAQKGVDYLFAVGGAARFLADGARDARLDESRIFVFNESIIAGRALQDMMKKGDVILLKGSQNVIRLERVVKEIMAQPHRASELLVRQGNEWQ